jgi:ABC-type molybdate transport system substrate-binding protein
MKKIAFAFLAAGLFIASCNNSGTTTANGTDSTGTTTANGTENATNNPNTNPAGTAATTAPSGPTTSIKFTEDVYDWGKIKQGETVEHTFKFTNTGEHDLVISDAKGSCGCTIPYYPKEPVAPGQTAEMKVSFNSTGKEGPQQKSVTVTANTDPPQTVINIKSEVIVEKK